MTGADDPTSFFWDVARPMLKNASVTRSTMMGFPCLRVKDQFFASADPKTGNLIVKLSASRVGALIEAGTGGPFAPAGRTFREWIVVSDRSESLWEGLMQEALRFVGDGAL